jgi:8-amino-7-oxononanoate synthase
MRLGRARSVAFAHSLVRDDHDTARKLKSLDEILSDLTRGEEGKRFRTGETNVFVAIESVYSMDGDVAPLTDIVECVEERLPNKNGYIIIDEAHSTGWLGKRGRGLVSHLGLEDRVWARIHTFGKAMGCAGGESSALQLELRILTCQPSSSARLTYGLT